MSDDVIFAAVPIFTGVAGHVNLLQDWQFHETLNAVVQLGYVYEVDGHV